MFAIKRQLETASYDIMKVILHTFDFFRVVLLSLRVWAYGACCYQFN